MKFEFCNFADVVYARTAKLHTTFKKVTSLSTTPLRGAFSHFPLCYPYKKFNLKKNDCTSQKFTRKKLTWKTFVPYAAQVELSGHCVCSTPSKAMECWSRPLDHWLAQSFNAHAPVPSTLPRNALQSLLITVNYQRSWLRASCDYKQLSPLTWEVWSCCQTWTL